MDSLRSGFGILLLSISGGGCPGRGGGSGLGSRPCRFVVGLLDRAGSVLRAMGSADSPAGLLRRRGLV